MEKLRPALAPLGFEPTLEVRALDVDTFRADPDESNRIWIAGRPLEEWLGAASGASPCCAACGGADCRTLDVGGKRYEAVPEELVVRAVLIAAQA